MDLFFASEECSHTPTVILPSDLAQRLWLVLNLFGIGNARPGSNSILEWNGCHFRMRTAGGSPLPALPACGWTPLHYRCMLRPMALSARNKLAGVIEEIQFGGVMAHIVIRVQGGLIESVITKRSADEMKLKVGDKVKAVIKSTEVMLEKN